MQQIIRFYENNRRRRPLNSTRLTPNSLVKSKFLHKNSPIVKNTILKKVRSPDKAPPSDYVNHLWTSTGFPPCGKLLWKNLWRMWKTASYQQVFCCFKISLTPVEKLHAGLHNTVFLRISPRRYPRIHSPRRKQNYRKSLHFVKFRCQIPLSINLFWKIFVKNPQKSGRGIICRHLGILLVSIRFRRYTCREK